MILISDLLDDPDRVIEGLKHFRFKGTEVVVFHVLDRSELTFPFERAARFHDLESDEEVMAVPAVVRTGYLKSIEGLIDAVPAGAGRGRHRLLPARHVAAPRLRAHGVSLDARAEPLMFGLAFLSPAFLAAATAVAVPIFIHLFRRRTEEQIRFSAVKFLKDAPVEHARRRRIRELLLLALRVSALVLLALAFARPYFASAESGFGAPITVVAVDVSYSMSAPGQFAQGDEARGASHRWRPCEAPGERRRVCRRRRGRDPADVGPGRSARGGGSPVSRRRRHELSRRAGSRGEAAGETGRIVLITDLQQSGWAGGESDVLLPPGVAIEVADVGGAGANLAVIDLRREAGGLSARVQNTGAAPHEGIVRLMVDDMLTSEAKFSVAPHAVTDARFDDSDATSGLASATLTDPNGFAADNTRYLLLDPPVPVTVMAVTSAASPADIFYLERALASGGYSSPFRVVSRAAVSFEGVDRASLRPYPLLLAARHAKSRSARTHGHSRLRPGRRRARDRCGSRRGAGRGGRSSWATTSRCASGERRRRSH